MAAPGFADRLTRAILDRRAPLCIALDPVFSQLPPAVRERPGANGASDSAAALDAILEFSRRVISVVAPIVPAIKINSAYFERYYAPGVDAYYALVRAATDHGLLVIGDIKRGDVGHSADMYARAHLVPCDFADGDGPAVPDAVTINGYLGLDGVKPFIDAAAKHGKGVFVLVRTSNESAAAIQDVRLADGRKHHELMAAQVAAWAAGSGTRGACGYSGVGAVVATRDAADAARLRDLMPESIFLVPGYGAQGGSADDVRPYFAQDGGGAIVAAGRSVIFAYSHPRYAAASAREWEQSVARACRDAASELARAAGL